MKRRHEMPFGATLLDEGGVRFRLWAPGPSAVELVLEGDTGQAGSGQALPMQRLADGFFERVVPHARAGQRYRFRLEGGLAVPDPASRRNPQDVHAASEVVDPRAFNWPDDGWRGRPWEEAVVYELHVGTFTPQGTFAAVIDRLDELAALGVTVVQLMPVAEFGGARGWGYDGVLWYAPESAYGTPEDLKRLVAAAHARGLMLMLDVVYNHFGPDGNYLGAYAPPFFTDRYRTPWGAAINYDGADGTWARRFAIENALYWIEEFHVDGLRLDAVHAIRDASSKHLLEELAEAVAAGPGRTRHVHLVLENDDNGARFLTRADDGRPRHYTAQWNDDIHHAYHVVATGETDGYYLDYAADPVATLGRCLAEGFAYQDDPSPYRHGERRGEPSRHLPPGAFVAFAQNHDQVGNRAFGERLAALAPLPALQAVTAIHLLSPQPPLLFMGEEFAAATPFLYFCDFEGDLGRAVTQGRRGEFARFERFSDPALAATIPDPNAAATFEASRLDWASRSAPAHARMLALYRELLALRHAEIVPRLAGAPGGAARHRRMGARGLEVRWTLGDGSVLTLLANLGDAPLAGAGTPSGEGPSMRLLWRTAPVPNAPGDALGDALGDAPSDAGGEARHDLPPWTVSWWLEPGNVAC